MTRYKNIILESDKGVATVWINRPEVHNALNEDLIRELILVFQLLENDNDLRLVILRGKGRSFSSGANLAYMKRMSGESKARNLEDARILAKLFESIDNFPLPVISVAHGTVAGGANGIVAASDLALAAEDTKFRFSEVKLGLVPATIAPYVLRKIGYARSNELMLTGRTFSSAEAMNFGMVTALYPPENSGPVLDLFIKALLEAAPGALKTTKSLLKNLLELTSDEQVTEYTSRLIAEVRSSSEAMEGLDAFFSKRKPGWINQ